MSVYDKVARQRRFYETGASRSLSVRRKALKRLEVAIRCNEKWIRQALWADLNKSDTEAYMMEIGQVLSEISYALRHMKEWSRVEKVHTSMAQKPGRAYKKPEPYGVVLIMSPWNYPFLLALQPLVGAIAAGNCCVIKPSAYAPHTAEILNKIVSEAFPEKYVTVISGGRAVNEEILKEKFDYIFFTGSERVGQLVMKKAAETLTPVTLELGGKSPCIVDESAALRISARRIAFGKFVAVFAVGLYKITEQQGVNALALIFGLDGDKQKVNHVGMAGYGPQQMIPSKRQELAFAFTQRLRQRRHGYAEGNKFFVLVDDKAHILQTQDTEIKVYIVVYLAFGKRHKTVKVAVCLVHEFENCLAVVGGYFLARSIFFYGQLIFASHNLGNALVLLGHGIGHGDTVLYPVGVLAKAETLHVLHVVRIVVYRGLCAHFIEALDKHSLGVHVGESHGANHLFEAACASPLGYGLNQVVDNLGVVYKIHISETHLPASRFLVGGFVLYCRDAAYRISVAESHERLCLAKIESGVGFRLKRTHLLGEQRRHITGIAVV